MSQIPEEIQRSDKMGEHSRPGGSSSRSDKSRCKENKQLPGFTGRNHISSHPWTILFFSFKSYFINLLNVGDGIPPYE